MEFYPKTEFYKQVKSIFKSNNEKNKLIFVNYNIGKAAIKVSINYCYPKEQINNDFSMGAEFIALNSFNIDSILNRYNSYPFYDFENLYNWKKTRKANLELK